MAAMKPDYWRPTTRFARDEELGKLRGQVRAMDARIAHARDTRYTVLTTNGLHLLLTARRALCARIDDLARMTFTPERNTNGNTTES